MNKFEKGKEVTICYGLKRTLYPNYIEYYFEFYGNHGYNNVYSLDRLLHEPHEVASKICDIYKDVYDNESNDAFAYIMRDIEDILKYEEGIGYKKIKFCDSAYITAVEDFRIEKVIFNDPATIVYWKDGDKTVVKCQDEDVFDPEKGLAMCFMKRALGNTGNFNDIFREWLPEEEYDYETSFVNALNGVISALTRGWTGELNSLAESLTDDYCPKHAKKEHKDEVLHPDNKNSKK